jgi:hypothetical protein
MVADLRQGAVLPPVVIGLVLGSDDFAKLNQQKTFDLRHSVPQGAIDQLSIIDGMQRTAALSEAVSIDREIENDSIRVEFWITTSVRAMVYRMLVLNTGQVPWTISRQLTVVYAPLLKELVDSVPELDRLIGTDNPGRRVSAAQYRADSIVELYMAFSLRKNTIDTREQVSDEFSRLDFVDNVADKDFQDQFYTALTMLSNLDKAFSRFESSEEGRMSRGRHIFDSQPARIGFMVAVGTAVLGRPGADKDMDARAIRMSTLSSAMSSLLAKLEALTVDALGDYLRLDVLREVLDRRVGQVGRYERTVFSEAFRLLVADNFELPNLEQCWRAA